MKSQEQLSIFSRIRISRITRPRRLEIPKLGQEWLNNRPAISTNWLQIPKMAKIPAKDKKVLNKATREMSGTPSYKWKSSSNKKKLKNNKGLS